MDLDQHLKTDLPRENWARHAVVYQIYPRSFKDTNGDGIGDLKGIIEKLDYLQDGTEHSLGVNAIWLNPIYRSPQKDYGYDISDYYSIDSVFGDIATFQMLTAEAHRRGIKVIMDFVPNHTSDEHPWFLESRSSPTNPKRNWYIWRDGKEPGLPPNNWLSVFGGSAWKLDPQTNQYYLHTFLTNQPDLNWRNQDVKNEMANVLKFWMRQGVDGFRTDAVYHLIKDSKLRDDPPNPSYVEERDDPYNALIHTHSTGQPEMFEAADTLCHALAEGENKFMISEAYLDIPGMEKLYRACENNLHAPFNLNILWLPWEASAYRKFIDQFEATLNENNVPNYVLGNHDRPRVMSRLGSGRTRLATMLLFTLRGMPFIYYGDELGMENIELPTTRELDPWGKNVPHLDLGRDGERSPMQWDGSLHAGFSSTDPWLPAHPNYARINVAAEQADPQSMFHLYRRLIHLKHTAPAILTGAYHSFDVGNNDVFAFTRTCPEQKALIMLNFSDHEQLISGGDAISKATLQCSTYLDRKPETDIDLAKLILRPYEGCIFLF